MLGTVLLVVGTVLLLLGTVLLGAVLLELVLVVADFDTGCDGGGADRVADGDVVRGAPVGDGDALDRGPLELVSEVGAGAEPAEPLIEPDGGC